MIEWSNKYLLGHDVIDLQHKEIFAAVRHLHEMRNNAASPSHLRISIGLFLMQIASYIKIHFAEEERLMRESGFEGLEEHCDQHLKLTRNFVQFQDKYKAATDRQTEQILDELETFMTEWLKAHIIKTDMKMGNHLKSQQVF